MNNKAFTLAEVLAVVIILSILVVLGIFSVESIIRVGTEKAYNAQLNEIKLAAENYVKIEGLPDWCNLNNDGDSCILTLRYLVHKKYLKLNEEGKFLNPKTDESFPLEMIIEVEKYGNNYLVEIIDEESATAAQKNEADDIKCALDSTLC